MTEAEKEATSAPAADAPPPFASEYSDNLPELLRSLESSLLVSTYNAGRLIVVRADGEAINTHYLDFQRPMGIAFHGSRIAIGTHIDITHFTNLPELVPGLEPKGKYDACYVPRGTDITGDLDIHEMAWDANGKLWLINTAFSCLCVHEPAYSFVPHWRPKFISALAREDRCHLNGLGLRDGRPRYVTALGESDTKEGWRENKKEGGVLIDVQHSRIVARSLNMPHSPRWYRNKLWLLESGAGSLTTVDPASGEKQSVVTLPGFTRGLDFIGKYAFVGVSKAREAKTFGDLPALNPETARECSVYVVDIEQSEVAGLLRFIGEVHEIFAVCALKGVKFPEIVDTKHELAASAYVLPDKALREISGGPSNLAGS